MTDKSGFHILINGRSGAALKLGRDVIEVAVANSGLEVHALDFVEPDDFTSSIEGLAHSGHNLMIAGGDGTIMKSVEPLMKAKIPCAFLPMGTMNLLAQDLNIPVNISDALVAYAQGYKKTAIDVAMVNNIPFLCAAGLGVMPEASCFREENRGQADIMLMPRLTLFVFDRLNHDHRRSFKLRMDGRNEHVRTTSLVISNNEFAIPEPEDTILANGFKKDTLRDGHLGIYTATPRTTWDRLRFLAKLRLGSWKSDPVINEYSARGLTVYSRRREELISLDGETCTLKTPLRFQIKPRSLAVLVPKPERPKADDDSKAS